MKPWKTSHFFALVGGIVIMVVVIVLALVAFLIYGAWCFLKDENPVDNIFEIFGIE